MSLCLEGTLERRELAATLTARKGLLSATLAKSEGVSGRLTKASNPLTCALRRNNISGSIKASERLQGTLAAYTLKAVFGASQQVDAKLSASLAKQAVLSASLSRCGALVGTLTGSALTATLAATPVEVTITPSPITATFVCSCPIDFLQTAFSLGAWDDDLPWDDELGWTD